MISMAVVKVALKHKIPLEGARSTYHIRRKEKMPNQLHFRPKLVIGAQLFRNRGIIRTPLALQRYLHAAGT